MISRYALLTASAVCVRGLELARVEEDCERDRCNQVRDWDMNQDT